MNRILILCLFSILLTFSCNDSNSSNDAEAKTAPVTNPAPAPTPALTLPSIPVETVQKLWQECDYIDFLYFELPISSSMKDKAAIQHALGHIAAQPAPLIPNCKPIGRIFYQIKGENYIEADMHHGEGCNYLVFYQNGKKIYSNYMTQDGITYINGQIQYAKEMTGKQ